MKILTQFPNDKSPSSRVALLAIMVTLALIFSYVEAIIPMNLGLPGVKLGIANLIVILALYLLDWKNALTINVLRVIVSGLLFSGTFGIIYSLSGGLISFATMVLLKKTDRFSIVGISVAGGVSHNLGQILMASFLVSNLKMFIYFPVLLFSGVGFGLVIGALATVLYRRVTSSGS